MQVNACLFQHQTLPTSHDPPPPPPPTYHIHGTRTMCIYLPYTSYFYCSISCSVRYSMIFQSCYLTLYYECAVPIEYRINNLSHSFHVRYCYIHIYVTHFGNTCLNAWIIFSRFTYKCLALPLTFHMVHHSMLHSQWF